MDVIVRVRRRYANLDAIVGRAAAHFNRLFEAVRAVIDLRQNVTVNIDHSYYAIEPGAIGKSSLRLIKTAAAI